METKCFLEYESTTTIVGEKICAIKNIEKECLSEEDVTIAIDEELEQHFEQLPNTVINIEKECLFKEDVTTLLLDEEICETINLRSLMTVPYVLPQDPYLCYMHNC